MVVTNSKGFTPLEIRTKSRQLKIRKLFLMGVGYCVKAKFKVYCNNHIEGKK